MIFVSFVERLSRCLRSLAERCITEMILQHQHSHQLSGNLWGAVRSRGCQFLGPGRQLYAGYERTCAGVSTMSVVYFIFGTDIHYTIRIRYVEKSDKII